MAHNNLARLLIDQGALAAGLENARRAAELIPTLPAHTPIAPVRCWASNALPRRKPHCAVL